jgi:phosphoglycolate phosphatase-like HAD superfamily hydrolase
MKVKNIIFDFDGVICQSKPYHLNKLNEVFNLGITEEEYSGSHHGNTNTEMRKREKFNQID